MLLDLLLVHLERIHQLGGQDLLRPREHLLLAGGQALFSLPDGQVANHLSELVDIARLDLVPVVLEAPVPVLGHLGALVLKHGEHLLDRLLVDHATQSSQRGVLGRNHHGHVVVEDLDREVLAALAEHLFLLLAQDPSGPMMRIDDAVANFELDIRERLYALKIIQVLFH